MAFRKLERQPAGGGGTRNTSVRIFHVSKQGPTIVIPAEVGRLAGIEPNSRIDLMLDSDAVPLRVAVVSKGDDLKATQQRDGGSLFVSGSRLKAHVPRMRTTAVGYEIGEIDGRRAVIITLPLSARSGGGQS